MWLKSHKILYYIIGCRPYPSKAISLGDGKRSFRKVCARDREVKVSYYIAQYPILRIAQNVLHFTSLADLFNQTPSQLLWEASSYVLQLMREGCSYTYPPLSIAKYSFIQLSGLEQCRVKKRIQDSNTVAQDSNPGPLSREALPLSHCTLRI